MPLTDFWMVCEHLRRQSESINDSSQASGGRMVKTAKFKRR